MTVKHILHLMPTGKSSDDGDLKRGLNVWVPDKRGVFETTGFQLALASAWGISAMKKSPRTKRLALVQT